MRRRAAASQKPRNSQVTLAARPQSDDAGAFIGARDTLAADDLRADRSPGDACFASAEQASEEARPAQAVLVPGGRVVAAAVTPGHRG